MGASGGGIWNQSSARQPTGPLPHLPTSTSQAAGPTPSRLLSLFEECVEHGIWATLETYKRRGKVSIDFCCSLNVVPTDHSSRRQKCGRKRARDVERTREWRVMRQQNRPSPPTSSPKMTALPAATPAVNGPALDKGLITAARSFAEVAAQPAMKKATDMPTTAKTVKDAGHAFANLRGRRAAGNHPTKRAKTTLAASRVSQRAAQLSKRRAEAAAVTSAPAPPESDEEDAAPEVLRGTDEETALNISLGSYSPTPPSPPSLTPLPALPPAVNCNTSGNSDTDDDSSIEYRTSITEADFKHEKWEDGRRLNTQDPSWEQVFRCIGAKYCRFCRKKPMPDPVVEGSGEYECENCFKLSTFQLVLKYAPKYRYPEN